MTAFVAIAIALIPRRRSGPGICPFSLASPQPCLSSFSSVEECFEDWGHSGRRFMLLGSESFVFPCFVNLYKRTLFPLDGHHNDHSEYHWRLFHVSRPPAAPACLYLFVLLARNSQLLPHLPTTRRLSRSLQSNDKP